MIPEEETPKPEKPQDPSPAMTAPGSAPPTPPKAGRPPRLDKAVLLRKVHAALDRIDAAMLAAERRHNKSGSRLEVQGNREFAKNYLRREAKYAVSGVNSVLQNMGEKTVPVADLNFGDYYRVLEAAQKASANLDKLLEKCDPEK